MKLNPDCIRDVLLVVEKTVDYMTRFEYTINEDIPKKLTKYTHDEIVYHIHQAKLSGLLYECHIAGGGAYITIDDLTPAGHEFLANIRSDSVWEKVKGAASATCGNSLRGIAQIAQALMIEIIKQYLGVT